MLRNPLYMGVVRVQKWGIEAAGDTEWDDIRAMNLHLLDSLLSSAP